MQKDSSFGIIPLKKEGESWKVFLVRHYAGHWGFPKGHKEGDETPEAAAIRELKEETGLEIVQFIPQEPLIEHYTFYHNHLKIVKTVTYFQAEVQGEILLQSDELSDGKWVSLETAEQHVTFEEAKKMCRRIKLLIN